LFLAIKEALNNAAKHSQAFTIDAAYRVDQFPAEVIVADNGTVFDSTQASQERNG